jgi:hypothetical protein
MARLTLTYQNLYDRVSHFLGLTVEGTSPTGNDLTLCKRIVDRGLRQFLYPIDESRGVAYTWSFVEQYWSFLTVSGKWKYALPVDFSNLLTHFSYDSDDALAPLKKRSGQQIKKMRSEIDSSGSPEYYAVVPTQYDAEIGTKYELWLYPTPGQVYKFSAFYRLDPTQLDATGDLAIGGIASIEAILESCLAVAETQEDDNTSTHHQQEARRLVQTLIQFDKGKTDTDVVGNLYQGREGRKITMPEVDFDNDVY